MEKVIYKSPAKLNLCLYVTGKRPDGYHELLSLMCPIGLHDDISFIFNTYDMKVRCTNKTVPDDEGNIAYKAASLFFEKLGEENGVHILIKKNIPVGAGLGGGSSNAAIVLRILNRFYKQPFSKTELMKIGLSVGADVPFFINGSPALVSGIGEHIENYTGNLPCCAVLIYPNIEVPTGKIFKKFNLELTKFKKQNTKSFFEKDKFDWKKFLHNDLEVISLNEYPEIKKAKQTLLNHGAEFALMTGSGSTVFGIFSSMKHAEEQSEKILKAKRTWQIIPCSILNCVK